MQGDLWVIYMGNNEVVGPFGAGTVFGPQAPKMPLIRASLALKATRTGQLLERWIGKRRGSVAPPKTWEGLGMFKEHQLRHDDPGRARVYENFGKNLEDILRTGRKAGVPVVLSTMAVNLKDCAPFASLHKAGLDENQKAAWEQSYKAGVVAADAGDPRTALAAFSNAASIDPEFADLHFRMGLCELALTNTAGATRDFEKARDFDALAFRADSRLNQIIVQAAARHSADGVKLVDAAEALAAQSSGGIAGEEYVLRARALELRRELRAGEVVCRRNRRAIAFGDDTARDVGMGFGTTLRAALGSIGLGSVSGLAGELQPCFRSSVYRSIE